MDFRILGPLDAINEAGPVELTGGKQKALLALLLLHADRVVAVDRIVDDLWGDEVPESAQKMVQIFISQLRKQLPDGLIQTRAPGSLEPAHKRAVEKHEIRHGAERGLALTCCYGYTGGSVYGRVRKPSKQGDLHRSSVSGRAGDRDAGRGDPGFPPTARTRPRQSCPTH